MPYTVQCTLHSAKLLARASIPLHGSVIYFTKWHLNTFLWRKLDFLNNFNLTLFCLCLVLPVVFRVAVLQTASMILFFWLVSAPGMLKLTKKKFPIIFKELLPSITRFWFQNFTSRGKSLPICLFSAHTMWPIQSELARAPLPLQWHQPVRSKTAERVGSIRVDSILHPCIAPLHMILELNG